MVSEEWQQRLSSCAHTCTHMHVYKTHTIGIHKSHARKHYATDHFHWNLQAQSQEQLRDSILKNKSRGLPLAYSVPCAVPWIDHFTFSLHFSFTLWRKEIIGQFLRSISVSKSMLALFCQRKQDWFSPRNKVRKLLDIQWHNTQTSKRGLRNYARKYVKSKVGEWILS